MRYFFFLFIIFNLVTYAEALNDINRWWKQINATYKKQIEEKRFNINWWNNACSNYSLVNDECGKCVLKTLEECESCFVSVKKKCDNCLYDCEENCKECLNENANNETVCSEECACIKKCSKECDFTKACSKECNCFGDCSNECKQAILTETCYNICPVGKLFKETFYATPPIVRPFIAPSTNIIIDYREPLSGLKWHSIVKEVAKQKKKADLTGSCDYLIINNGVPVEKIFQIVEPAGNLFRKVISITPQNNEEHPAIIHWYDIQMKLWVVPEGSNYKVWFEIDSLGPSASGEVTLIASDNQPPDWVGANPYSFYVSSNGRDIQYWTPVREDEFPLSVKIELSSEQVRCQKMFVIYATDHSLEDINAVADKVNQLYQRNGSMTFVLGIETTHTEINEIAQAGGTEKAYYPLSDKALGNSIADIFQRIKRVQVGSFAGLASVGPEGYIIIQPTFYPYRKVGSYSLDYPGYLLSYWYYLKLDQIREDTNLNKELNLDIDNIIKYANTKSGDLLIERFDPFGNPLDKLYSFEETNRVVDFGEKLENTPPEERKIYTNLNGTLVELTSSLSDKLKDIFGFTEDFTTELINWIKGKDSQYFRSRTLKDGNTWKLGDIVDSKPLKVDYDNYTVIYVGSNDGMLHAFKLGYLWYTDNTTEINPAKLYNSKNDKFTDKTGKELWAFIPKNALPYLPYVAKKYYKHLYVVDLSPYLVEFKGRKILIGGMGFGGATGYPNGAKPPIYACQDVKNKSCIGFSSYFALDVTNPEEPKLLWEFTHPYLGLTISGPAIVRKGDKAYVVFVNGPEFANATVVRDDFNEEDIKKLRFFILDLLSGELVNVLTLNVGQPAFGGRLFKEGWDINNDGKTDFVFVGFSYADGSPTNWKGGLALLDVQDEDPHNWMVKRLQGDINPVVSKVVVSTCIGKPYIYFGTGRWFYKFDDTEVLSQNALYGLPLKCETRNSRYECELKDSPNGAIDVTNQQNADNICEEYHNGNRRGWKILLKPANGDFLKEKSISDPVVTLFDVNGTTSSAILFTTSQPYQNLCSVSAGRSRVWFVNCLTGAGTFSDICPETQPSTSTFCALITIETTPGAGGGESGGTSVEIIPLPQSYCTSVLLTTSGGQIFQANLITIGKNRVSEWFEGGVSAIAGASVIFPKGSSAFEKTSVPPGKTLRGTILLWLEF